MGLRVGIEKAAPVRLAITFGVGMDQQICCRVMGQNAHLGGHHDIVGLFECLERVKVHMDLNMDEWPGRAGAQLMHAQHARIIGQQGCDMRARGVRKFAVEKLVDRIASQLEG